MEEQLPVPLMELLVLNLYLGSVTYLIGIAFIGWAMKRNRKFNWIKLLIITVLLLGSGCFFSLLAWSVWSPEVDLMYGALHLPTLLVLPFLSVILLKIFGYNILTKNPLLVER